MGAPAFLFVRLAETLPLSVAPREPPLLQASALYSASVGHQLGGPLDPLDSHAIGSSPRGSRREGESATFTLDRHGRARPAWRALGGTAALPSADRRVAREVLGQHCRGFAREVVACGPCAPVTVDGGSGEAQRPAERRRSPPGSARSLRRLIEPADHCSHPHERGLVLASGDALGLGITGDRDNAGGNSRVLRAFPPEKLASTSRRGGQLTPGTVHNLAATLGAVLAEAVAEGLVSDNPLRGLWRELRRGSASGKRGQRVKALTTGEAQSFVRAAEQTEPVAWPALALMLLAGLRAGEASAVRADRLDRSASRLLVDRQLTQFGGLRAATKTGEPRSVERAPQLLELLERVAGADDAARVVTIEGGALDAPRAARPVPRGAGAPGGTGWAAVPGARPSHPERDAAGAEVGRPAGAPRAPRAAPQLRLGPGEPRRQPRLRAPADGPRLDRHDGRCLRQLATGRAVGRRQPRGGVAVTRAAPCSRRTCSRCRCRRARPGRRRRGGRWPSACAPPRRRRLPPGP